MNPLQYGRVSTVCARGRIQCTFALRHLIERQKSLPRTLVCRFQRKVAQIIGGLMPTAGVKSNYARRKITGVRWKGAKAPRKITGVRWKGVGLGNPMAIRRERNVAVSTQWAQPAKDRADVLLFRGARARHIISQGAALFER